MTQIAFDDDAIPVAFALHQIDCRPLSLI